MTRSLLALVLLAALVGACGRPRCGEIPQLVVEPSVARAGEQLVVRPERPYEPCRDRRTDTMFRPLPRDTYMVEVMIAPARVQSDGRLSVLRRPIEWGAIALDEDSGTFEFLRTLPVEVQAGDYAVFLRQQPDSRAHLRVRLGR